MRGTRISAILAAFLLVTPLIAAQEGLRVGVLYTGDPYPGQTPYVHMKVEAFLRVTPVQASRNHYAGISSDDILRAIRIYMPRRYQDLIDSYDVLIISDANVMSFESKHLKWFKQSVEEDAMGLAMFGGYESYGGAAGEPDWGATPVGDVLPVTTDPGQYEDGKVTILDEENRFMSSLPWRPDLTFLQNYASNIVQLKPSAELLASSRIHSTGYENPFYSTWVFGEGRTFAMTGDWTPGGGWNFLRWEYLPDFATNLMLYCADRPIPRDLELVHTVRTLLERLAYERMIVDSLIDFVERFGANPDRILAILNEFDEAKGEASRFYLQQEFESALDTAEGALDILDRADKVSEQVKNEALFWVYLSEWLTVTATLLVSGFLIWSLMIRRRLYRQVRSTRFR
jgi:uncharacterized membrane protein